MRQIKMYDMEDYFWRKNTEYRSFHNMKILGYVDLTCCVIAVISNAFVLFIFTRKNIITPINTIFIHIAITESVAFLGYVPRTWHEYFRVEKCAIPQHRTYFWEEISVLSYITAFTFRFIGVWLAVMLGIWRYIAVIHPLKERHWCNPEITNKLIVMGYVFGAILAIPPYFALDAGSTYKLLDQDGCSTSNNVTGNLTKIYEFQLPIENYTYLYAIATLFYGVFVKILPSAAFLFINYKLVNRLLEVKRQRISVISEQQCRQRDRTTIILVLIMTLFLVGEVPHGIFCVLTAYYGPPFYWRYYHYGMEISNTLTHISVSFNFIIYYAMSQQFRETFKALIRGNSNELRRINIFGSNCNLHSSKINNTLCQLNSNQSCKSNQTNLM